MWYVVLLALAVGLLVVLPINNAVEYGHAIDPVSPLGMVRNAVEWVALLIAIVWYSDVWRRVEPGIWQRLRRDRILLVAFIWSAVAYAWLWWLVSSSRYLADSAEHTGIMILALAAPTLSFHFLAKLRVYRVLWREGGALGVIAWIRLRKRWIIGVPGLTCAVLLGLFLYYVKPVLDVRAAMRNGAAPSELRRCLHRVVRRMPSSSHNAYITLMRVGDETSVPVLLEALESAPPVGTWICTWGHCVEALEAITNQRPGSTPAAWEKWYAENRDKSRPQWIADGFRARGVDASATQSEKSARVLLGFLGEGEYNTHEDYGDDEQDRFALANARVLLQSYDAPLVERVVLDALGGGTAAEKRGALRYRRPTWTDADDDLARPLVSDADRSVRLEARSLLLRAERGRVSEKPGLLLSRTRLGVRPHGYGLTLSNGFIYVPVRRDTLLAYDTGTQKEAWRFSVGDDKGHGFKCPLVRDGRVYVALSGGALYCLDARTGSEYWRVAAARLGGRCRHEAPLACGDGYVAVETYRPDRAGGESTVIVATADGAETARTEGALLGVRGLSVVTHVGSEVEVRSAPRLLLDAEFRLSDRPVGVGFSGDTITVVLTDAEGNSSSEWGWVRVEGWSLTERRMVYATDPWRMELAGDLEVRQGPNGVLYIAGGKVACAIDPADGTSLWEAPIGGDLTDVGDRLVLADYKTVTVLDARVGALLAILAPAEADSFGDNVKATHSRVFAVDYTGELFIFRMP